MQKSLGAKSTARRLPLRVLSSNKARPPPESLRPKPPPPAAPAAAASGASAATADAALDRLLLARSDLAGIVSEIDKLLADAIQCQTVSKSGEQEIESFSCFLSDTNSSLKQWTSRLKQALKTCPEKTENVSKHTLGTCSNSAAEQNGKLNCSSTSSLPDTDSAMSPSCNLLSSSSNILPETDMIVSPSPLVSWRAGACMVESGKQLFLLTPLPKQKACSSRCPTSKTQMKTTSSMSELNLPSLPVWKLTISDDDHRDLEQGVKVKEAGTGTVTPHISRASKDLSKDRLCSPCSFSIQKSTKALPRSCLKSAVSGKQQLFSPIPEGSRKEDAESDGPIQGGKRSESSDGISSDEISKDLASRYGLCGFNKPTTSTYHRREVDEPLDWLLSPLKTCVLTELSDDKPVPTPASKNLKGRQDISDDLIAQTPAVHSKALLPTPWKGLESTNLKGRHAGETTLKRELWTRFEAVSTNELHFNKSVFQKAHGNNFLDMLEEAS
ncbi:hypothetical protein ACP70R_039563 [Stipagrostis hirtigluma subsp. patula]